MHAADDDDTALPLPQVASSNSDAILAGTASAMHVLTAPSLQQQPSSNRPAATRFEHEGNADDVDEAEVLFLIADYLKRRSKCSKAADVLIDELTEHRLLKDTMTWQGDRKPSTYADYRLRHRDIAPTHLLGLMQSVVTDSTASATGSAVATTSSPRSNSSTPRSASFALTPRSSSSSSSISSISSTSTRSRLLGTTAPRSLLLKSRLAHQTLELSQDARRALAKDIVATLFELRANVRTQRVVARVVHKFERLREYTTVASIDDLPLAVRNELLQVPVVADVLTVPATGPATGPATDTVSSLAADVRALRQLLELKHAQRALDAKLNALMDRATRATLLVSRARTGRNQATLLQRRQVQPAPIGALPLPFVYSRVRRLKTLCGHLQIRAFCLTYDKLGQFVITGADDRLVKIWSLMTGDLLFTLRGHVGNITDLAVNSANSLLASSSDDKTVRVWELRTGAPVAVLLGHTSIVNAVRFHPTRDVVVTASNDGRCFCYTLPAIVPPAPCETKVETAQRLNACGAYLLSLHPVFSLAAGALRQGVRSCKVLCLSFSRCGKFVVTGSQDGVGRVWDVSVLSGSDAPVSTSQYQHEDALQLNVDRAAAPAAPVDNGPLPVAPLAAEQPAVPLAADAEPQGAAPVAVVDTPFGAAVAPAAAPAVPATDGVEPQALGADAPAVPAAAVLLPLPLQLPELPPPPQTQLPQLPQTTAALPDVDMPALPALEPVAVLQGHSGPVTNIVFSNDGRRIATASIKDGTTRVWVWDDRKLKKTKKLAHTVLLADEPDADADADALASLYGVQTRKRPVPAVDTLSWSHDDRRLVTLHSVKPESHAPDAVWQQRVRVWDPATGALVFTLAAIDRAKRNGHTNAVFVMDVHPHDWRIVVTAGYDGRIFLWDIASGTMLKAFTNVSPDGELVPLLDGGFTPDGTGLCFTDRIGRLLVFGTGSGEQFAATPVQQYFPSDYAALVTDRHLNVLDRETQQIPSLMAPGPLVDIYQIEYAHQPPHLLPAGAASLTPEQRAQNRRLRIEQATESEIKCRVRHALDDDRDACESFPSAVLPRNRRDRRTGRTGTGGGGAGGGDIDGVVAPASYRLNGAPVALSELRRRYNAAGGRRRSAAASLDERDTSVLNMVISSEDDRSDEDFQAPPTRSNRLDDDDDEDEDEDDDDDDDDDDELDDDDLLSDRDADDGESPRFHRRRRLRAASSRSSTSTLRFPRRGGRRLRDSAANDVDGVDNSSDDDDEAPRRRTRRHAAAALTRRRRVGASDDDGDDNTYSRSRSTGGADSRDSSAGAEHRQQTAVDDDDDDDPSTRDVVVETNDGFIMGDNQLDRFDRSVTYAELLAAKRQQLGQPDAAIVCAFCHSGDDGGVLQLPGDSMGEHPLVNGAQRLFVHDQCAIASPLCFNRDGRWYNVTKEIRRGRSLVCAECKARGATVGCTVESCPRSYHWKCALSCGWAMHEMHFYCPLHEAQRSGAAEQSDSVGGRSDADSSGRSRIAAGATGSSGAGSNSAQDDQVTKRFGLTFHREWLQQLSLATTQSYVPQLGDYVTYFPQGHTPYQRACHEPTPAFAAQFRTFFALKCRVADVRYVFPTLAEYAQCQSIKCELTLAVLAVPTAAFDNIDDNNIGDTVNTIDNNTVDEETKSDEPPPLFDAAASPFAQFTGVDAALQPTRDAVAERFQFAFTYHPHDVANFVVLDHVYERGVRGDWRVGERVEMPIVELNEHGAETASGRTYGVIRGFATKFVPTDDSVDSVDNASGQQLPVRRMQTPWECVEVDWADPDLAGTNVSPWEIEPVAGTPRWAAKQRAERAQPATALYRSRRVTGAKRAVLLQELETIRHLSISRDFLYPVDSSFLDYVLTVANPVDLTKLQQRVRNGYYRQVEAFLADAALLCSNCETYNVSTSSIAQNARSIYAALLSQVLRHFPALLRSEDWDPHGACRMFRFPPSDTVDGFPEADEDDNDSDNVDTLDNADALLQVLEPTAAELEMAAAAMTASASSVTVMQSPTTRSSVRTSHVHASPVRSTRRSISTASDTPTATDNTTTSQLQSPRAAAQRTPRNTTATALTKRPNVVVNANATPARAGPRARTTSAASNSDTPSRANKRQRQQPPRTVLGAAKSARATVVDGLVDHDALLDSLTTAQRELLATQCDDDLSQVLRDFHEALMQLDVHEVFATAVTEDVAPGYFSVIAHPMDFGLMAEKLDGDEYDDFETYFDDLYLTLSNAITYNTWDGFVGEVVTELQAHFVKFLLDAIGGGKPEPSASRKSQQLLSRSRSSVASTLSNKPQKAKAKAKASAPAKRTAKAAPLRGNSSSARRRAVSDDDDDDDDDESVNSVSDARDDTSDNDESDDDDESKESDDTSDESDWGGNGRKRKQQQQQRRASSLSKRRRA